jgi:hypothetical protein
MPRFIWVAEVSTFNIYSNTRKILGEIIFDSTSNKFVHKDSILAVHLPGFFFQAKYLSQESYKDENIGQEEPYLITHRS